MSAIRREKHDGLASHFRAVFEKKESENGNQHQTQHTTQARNDLGAGAGQDGQDALAELRNPGF